VRLSGSTHPVGGRGVTCDIGLLASAQAHSREGMIARAMRAAGMAPLQVKPSAAPTAPLELDSEPVAGLVLVAHHDDEVLGTGTLVGHWICDLYVEPACWRQGIGRLILMKLEDHARIVHASGLGLFAVPHSAGFYERCGYTPQGNGLRIHGQAVVQMHKRLRP
jgi:GNAT superfamily N-acetyltransferase